MRYYLFFTFFILLISFDKSYGVCENSGLTLRQQDSCQLVNLYNSAGGSNWINPWNLAMRMNNWLGVKVNANGRVTSLILNNRRVVGSFPENFALSELDTLTIANGSKTTNCLSRELLNFANFPLLKYVNLSNNCFSDTLPETLPAGLEHLNLSGSNSLYGSIKHYGLSQLKMLNLSRNAFSEGQTL